MPETTTKRPWTARPRYWRLLIAGVLFGVYGLAFHVASVHGRSMNPTLFDEERVLVERVGALFGREYTRGEIVVFAYPHDPDVDLIKRVIGLPGDVVAIRNGRVFVNERPLDEPYRLIDVRDTDRWIVPAKHYFVLGDNRPVSCDSRTFSFVAEDAIKGRVVVRLWPFPRVSRL